MKDFVVTLFAVLIQPVVEGVAVTGFLFFLTPTQYYQQSGDSTQEINSRALKITHKRPFTPMYLGNSSKSWRSSLNENFSVLFQDCHTIQGPSQALVMVYFEYFSQFLLVISGLYFYYSSVES